MRWMWIDRVVELVPRQRLVAVKNVSLAEEHLHDHFEPVVNDDGRIVRPAMPIMPASLIIEGMAQAGGILVGHAEEFREKVILAKVSRAELSREATPGCQLRYTAEIKSFSHAGAGVSGTVELAEPSAEPETIGRIELLFSHLDRNMAGIEYPEHNFVFGEGFRTLLRTSGIID
ncbi:MAG TPA: beta-hydroxyacyl-ACP dehydratase [Phycisphaerales bacterium]|nr:beta-hydroxyacyl-ACP dehydratase [Phycisphaerales bacterium]